MATAVRERMITGAAQLLAERGLLASSFSEVLERTRAPRGSIYHHFPGGKDELVGEAIRHVGRTGLEQLRLQAGLAADEVVVAFIDLWRRALLGSDITAGCALAAITVEAGAGNPALVALAGGVFWDWLDALTGLLSDGGIPPVRARRVATTVIAGLEGALVLSRATRDLAPFDAVAAELADLARLAAGAKTVPGPPG